jgi:hypothetical protein
MAAVTGEAARNEIFINAPDNAFDHFTDYANESTE